MTKKCPYLQFSLPSLSHDVCTQKQICLRPFFKFTLLTLGAVMLMQCAGLQLTWDANLDKRKPVAMAILVCLRAQGMTSSLHSTVNRYSNYRPSCIQTGEMCDTCIRLRVRIMHFFFLVWYECLFSWEKKVPWFGLSNFLNLKQVGSVVLVCGKSEIE